MEAAMRKMGVQQHELDAKEVIIRLKSGNEIFLPNPSVTKVSMMGQETFQVAGAYSERPSQQSQGMQFNEDDVKTVAEQSGVSTEEAKAALARVGGDLASAIMLIEKEKK